ncbi:glycosyltransferase [Paenarthrobacter nicotinovorans]|uniref:glycosyltransferase n=1 Tax=Paenarthrobacter nicotinovorans TaxID=29320 RepID=UPI0011A697CC|nr:glycosyltransferase [Paenarthrobacter nicotinovorans]
MGPTMYISGGRWDDLPGTDRLLAEALAVVGPLIWVDQPAPVFRFRDVRKHLVPSLLGVPEVLTPQLTRLRLPAPPLFSSSAGRPVTKAIARHCMQKALRNSEHPPAIIVNASPVIDFPVWGTGVRLLHLTDDWLAAADLIGFGADYLRRSLERNIEAADIISAVSPDLAAKMSAFSGRTVEVLPNGCRPPTLQTADDRRRPVAVLVGQLNERLDLDVLEALGDAGLEILVIGPRTESNPVTGRRLDAFLSRENVDWRGAMDPRDLGRLLGTASVGITPYADTEFNRSSFPLKTLEYLSAGLRVVASDLPSLRSLTCSTLAVAVSPEEFVELVRIALRERPDQGQRDEMRRLAEANTWDVRAATLIGLCQRPAARTEPSQPDRTVAQPVRGVSHDH